VRPRRFPKPLLGLVDVDCPLTGPEGALQLFGPQKGIPPEQAQVLDRAMVAYAFRLTAVTGADPAAPGAGAAGGMGFAVLALGGRLVPGAEAVAGWVDLDRRLAAADGVITGEGRLDGQSAHGKVVGLVARRARAAGRRAWALCGSRGPGAEALYDLGLTGIYPLVPGPLPLRVAMDGAAALLEEAAYHLGRWLRAEADGRA
ncbi:MAG: glycerate kinase, partial [Firmicutes bacterium]|nr:glycerate kinase [Bacillota bacterium]